MRRFTSDAKRGAPLPGGLIDEVNSANRESPDAEPRTKLKSAIEMQRRSVDTSMGIFGKSKPSQEKRANLRAKMVQLTGTLQTAKRAPSTQQPDTLHADDARGCSP